MNLSEEDTYLLLNSLNFKGQISDNLKNAYSDYKLGKIDDLSLEMMEEMEVTFILEQLGFSVNEIGRFLYAKMIVGVLSYLKGIPVRGIVLTSDELVEQLNNKFSQFYLDVARNDLDIGIKTYHFAIERSILAIDTKNCKERCIQILGECYDLTDYPKNAFLIATYIYGVNKKRDEDELIRKRISIKSDSLTSKTN